MIDSPTLKAVLSVFATLTLVLAVMIAGEAFSEESPVMAASPDAGVESVEVPDGFRVSHN